MTVPGDMAPPAEVPNAATAALASAATPANPPMQRVFRNAGLLVVAQVLSTPLSLLINVMAARWLRVDDFGILYLAGVLTNFATLFVEWGQAGVLPALIARDRGRAGEYFGTALVWRVLAAPVVGVALVGACRLMGNGREFEIAIALSAAGMCVTAVTAVCYDAVRGFERTDVAAVGLVGQQIFSALVLIPTLLLGGRLRAFLVMQILINGAAAIYAFYALQAIGKLRIQFRWPTLRRMVGDGTSFLALNVSMALQPSIDAAFLSRLAPMEATAWLAAAKKLVGVLVFPANTFLTAFYPTLARLWTEDRDAFRESAVVGLRAATLLVIPVALGCALYPDLGIRIYSRRTFGAAGVDLRVMSLFVLFLYFSMMLGSWLAAAQLNRRWAVCQLACVVVSAIADPLLIPFFQSRFGNGGLGVCVSTDISEALMVAGGLWLAPAGILSRRFLRSLAMAGVAGGAMGATAWLLSPMTPFVAAPVSVVAYVACLWLTGAVSTSELRGATNMVMRKFGARAKAAA